MSCHILKIAADFFFDFVTLQNICGAYKVRRGPSELFECPVVSCSAAPFRGHRSGSCAFIKPKSSRSVTSTIFVISFTMTTSLLYGLPFFPSNLAAPSPAPFVHYPSSAHVQTITISCSKGFEVHLAQSGGGIRI